MNSVFMLLVPAGPASTTTLTTLAPAGAGEVAHGRSVAATAGKGGQIACRANAKRNVRAAVPMRALPAISAALRC